MPRQSFLERSHRPSRVARRLGPGTFASFIRLTYRLGPPSDGLFSASERPATPDFHVSEETLMQTPKRRARVTWESKISGDDSEVGARYT